MKKVLSLGLNCVKSFEIVIRKIIIQISIILFLILICSQLFSQNRELELLKIKNVVYDWTLAHNNKDYNKFQKLYATKLLYYCKELNKDFCIKSKRNALKANPKFTQTIVTDIEITYYENGTIKCGFTKKIRFKKKDYFYPSYLLLKQTYDSFVIVGEGDEITNSQNQFSLNLGKQMNFSTPVEKSSFDIKKYAIITFFILMIFFLIAKLIKIRKHKDKKNTVANEDYYTESTSFDTGNPNISSDAKNKNDEYKKKTKETIYSTVTNTQKWINVFFDITIKIDSFFYGFKLLFFIITSLIIVILFSIFDFFKINSTPWDIIVILIYFIFIINTLFALIGSWRDDNGDWTYERFVCKIKMYIKLIKEYKKKYSNKSNIEYLYLLGIFLFFFGICLKSLVLLTKYIRYLSGNLISINILDNYIIWFNIFIFIGVFIVIYLAFSHKEVFNFKKILGWEKDDKKTFVNKIRIKDKDNAIIDINNNLQIKQLLDLNNNDFLKNIILMLSKWKPQTLNNEFAYHDELEFQLRSNFQNLKIVLGKQIKSIDGYTKGNPDFRINDNIIIEMKAKNIGSEFDRVQGQLNKYSMIWGDKGPVILIMNKIGYENAQKRLLGYFSQQIQCGKNMIAFVID